MNKESKKCESVKYESVKYDEEYYDELYEYYVNSWDGLRCKSLNNKKSNNNIYSSKHVRIQQSKSNKNKK
jgi:hypothetical protein